MSLDQYLVPEDDCPEKHHYVKSGQWYHATEAEGVKGLEFCERRNRK